MALDATTLCISCNNPSAYSCRHCKCTSYCSNACEQSNWTTHKLLCSTFSSFDSSRRPSGETFRAILFPDDDKIPEFVWLRCTWLRVDDDEDDADRYQSPEVRSFLGPHNYESDIQLQNNSGLKRKLSDTIYICYSNTFLVDGSKANNCITDIIKTNRLQKNSWRGPVIAYGKVGLGLDQTSCRDLDMNDFRHIIDYFLSWHASPAPAPLEPFGPSVKGVRINCLGDEKMFGKPHFEAVELSPADLIFSNSDTSDIADRIGLPIFIRRCSLDTKWSNKPENENFDFSNTDALDLLTCCGYIFNVGLTTKLVGWGAFPKDWIDNTGSVIVARQDKKLLLPLHVEALCRYCRYEILPLIGHSRGGFEEEDPLERDTVLAMICRPTFIVYWCKLLEERHVKWLKNLEKGKDTKAADPYDEIWPYDVE